MASFETTTANLPKWKAALAQALGEKIRSTAQSTPEAGSVYLCYFDGDFGQPRGPVPPSAFPDWSRVVVLVDANGDVDLLAAGFKEGLPVIDPNG